MNIKPMSSKELNEFGKTFAAGFINGIEKSESRMNTERIEAAEELLEDMKECFLDGTSLRIEENDFNLVSWLIEEVKRKYK
ncbi:TPA: hypothetical protein QC443_002466 [Bacillus cereus]|uniref:Uncharacterized protein n=1 Tax=Bacillus cereus (strain Q1) TaxID=361100 RepID=B9J6L6_BACCQ|nr:hypothetical protein [Bacillus paranthracis]ACM16011.1 conserved hypothetical protein [Bacillus cereus Q1]HDR8058710.1 hypothetical protein [Bacillus cereus]HDR8076395.1 hypothetical protein [Bacillus cereus]HDR8205446.1 hypothetical protein [Bacillus cereus]HDR8210833.1 hypothetical protein [Bacillus cereus]